MLIITRSRNSSMYIKILSLIVIFEKDLELEILLLMMFTSMARNYLMVYLETQHT